MIGLDNAGKTTALYKMNLGEVVTRFPNIAFTVETSQCKNLNFTVWDLGGRGGFRSLWRHYYQNTQGIIFVVDSNDQDRISECNEELNKIMNEALLKEIPLLVFANKQDLPNVMSLSEITDKLELSQIINREWYIQSSCMVNGDGMYEGFDWLREAIGRKLLTKLNSPLVEKTEPTSS